jgi:perosamine synthetase
MQFSKPNLSALESRYVQEVMNSGQLASGPFVDRFEAAFKAWGYDYAVAMNSGTSALKLALEALGIGPGDEVIVSPFTMVASVNVVLAVGATPVFADIDRHTYNITPQTVQQVLTYRTKAVIPVDIFGVPCDVSGIRDILPGSIYIVQDACEALGARHKGELVGQYADAAVFSFFPNKQITTGDGGMLVTRNKTLAEKVRALSRHGVLAGASMYEQSYGYNYRMSDLHAAVGCAQMERFNEICVGKFNAYDLLDRRFEKYRVQRVLPGDSYVPFVYVIEVPKTVDKKTLVTYSSVPLKPYFVALHHLEHLKEFVRQPLPVCEEVARATIALPYHHDLTEEDVRDLWVALEGELEGYSIVA